MTLEDSSPENLPRPLPETTKSANGDLISIGQDDLVQREKKRLGDYLAYQTQQVFKNEFPIKGDSVPFSLKTPSGNPAPIVDVDTNAVSTYMDTFSEDPSGQKARSEFEKSSESGLLDTDTKFFIKKGKSDNQYRTGTEYFREIDAIGGEAEVPKRIQQAMLDNNRFNENVPAFRSGQREGVGNSLGSLIVQPTLGQHAPQRWPNKNDGGNELVSISIDKLKNLGVAVMLQASGEAIVPTDLNDLGFTLGADSVAAVPGLARMGARIPVTRFDTVKILNQAEPNFKKQIRDETLAGAAVPSYGNVNNVLAPFNGLIAASSVNSAALLSLTVANMIKGLYVTLNALDSNILQTNGTGFQQNAFKPKSELRKLRLGNYKGKVDDSSIYRTLRDDTPIEMVQTRKNYFDCVNRGINIFFNAPENAKIGALSLGVTKTVQMSHGYYNVVFRNILRTTNDLLTNVFKPLGIVGRSAYDVDRNLGNNSNPVTDLASTAIGYVEQINKSPLLKFMNILAMIGDSSFAQEAGETRSVDNIRDVAQDSLGNTIPKLGVLHMKSRLSDTFGNKLSWGNGTIQSMLLLPSEIKTAATKFDGNDSRFALMTPEKGFRNASNGRFSQGEVKKMEDYLEADYMPFYFHDIRTNEIISFHAFMENISDEYDVEYTENEGYGRVGKVLTYKNTNRSISMDFSVVATNPSDFDEMWFKINKLVTLLYPQYTQGRNLRFGENSFIQPFSQLPGASPLCRIRLGDIFKSNYNKFDLARIFGLASPEFSLETSAAREAREENSERENRLATARQNIRARMERKEWQVGDKVYADATTGDYSGYFAGDGVSQNQLNLPVPRIVTITQVLESPLVAFTVDDASSTESGTWRANGPWLNLYEPDIERQAQDQVGAPVTADDAGDANQTTQAISDFFNPEGDDSNPIFKSFESVRGRGLAGFIRSFRMELDNTIPWETFGLNNRAPKMVKISLQFDPIHDLSPGLDHNGYNAAPVYNIGNWMKQSTKDDSASLETREMEYKTNTQATSLTRNKP